MKRLALIALLVACKPPQERAARQDKPPADAARHYTAADFASASYLSLETIIADGKNAKNKLASLHLVRHEIHEDDFSAFACDSVGAHSVYLTLPDDQRDFVRALPKNARGACPRVLVRIWSVKPFMSHLAADGTWVDDDNSMKVIVGEPLVIDTKPVPPTPPPAGVQFATFDDIVLSKFKGGELAELTMEVLEPSTYSTHVVMRTCEEDSGMIDFPDEKLDGALAKKTGCQVIRLKLRPRHMPGLEGQTIEADWIQN